MWLGLCGDDGRSAQPPAQRVKLTPVQRMAPARLKAVHEDVLRIQQSRHDCRPLPDCMITGRSFTPMPRTRRTPAGPVRRCWPRRSRPASTPSCSPTITGRPETSSSESWRGLHDGVLFIPGSEERGFLLYPAHSIMDRMEEPLRPFIKTVTADGGLIFLSHIEERPDHPMDGPGRHGDLQPPRRRQEGQGRPAGTRAQADLARRRSRSFRTRSSAIPTSCSPSRWSIPRTTWPSGTRKPPRAGSPAWPPTIAITTW